MMRLLISSTGVLLLFCLSHAQEATPQNNIGLCADPVAFYKKIELAVCSDEKPEGYSLGICWNTEPQPTIFNPFVIFQEPQETFEHTILDLKPNTDYYFLFFKLYADGRIDYFSPFSVATLPELRIGQAYQGGIISYLFKPKDSLYVEGEQHGLILAPEELGYAAWGMHGQAIAGGTNHKAGYGRKNTEAIVQQYGAASVVSSNANNSGSLKIIHPCAALLCASYENEGWKDWFLPSKGDWELIFSSLDSLNMVKLTHGENYWSSSEVFISWKWSKKSRSRPTTSQFKRAWQIRYPSSALMLNSIKPKHSSARVMAMRYF